MCQTSTVLKSLLLIPVGLLCAHTAFAQVPAPQGTKALQSASDVKSCVLIHAVNPKLPPQASSKKHDPIVLHAKVAANGTVQDVSVVSGDPVLVGPAMDAARQYQFAPCIRNGVPVESQTDITVMYDLRRAAAYPVEVSSTVEEPQENVIQEIEHGELFQLHDGLTFPKVLHKSDPVYSEAARKDKLEGYVLLGLVVGAEGKPRSLWVVRPLGEGLDENAIDAVKQWIFTPATKEGKPVPILINLAIEFRR